MVNRALSALKQLASGRLNDDLFKAPEELAGATPGEGDAAPLAASLRGPIARCLERRPAGAPVGAAAVARQQG
eukprot:6895670-Lingulodinium_polyedra.AAC.1